MYKGGNNDGSHLYSAKRVGKYCLYSSPIW